MGPLLRAPGPALPRPPGQGGEGTGVDFYFQVSLGNGRRADLSS